jgi:hypothetical protein
MSQKDEGTWVCVSPQARGVRSVSRNERDIYVTAERLQIVEHPPTQRLWSPVAIFSDHFTSRGGAVEPPLGSPVVYSKVKQPDLPGMPPQRFRL